MALLSGDDDLACECVLAGLPGRGFGDAPTSRRGRCAPSSTPRSPATGAEARKLDAQLQRLHKAMFLETNPIPVKWAVARLGLIQDGIRLPLVPLSKQFHGQVMEAMQSAGIGFA